MIQSLIPCVAADQFKEGYLGISLRGRQGLELKDYLQGLVGLELTLLLVP